MSILIARCPNIPYSIFCLTVACSRSTTENLQVLRRHKLSNMPSCGYFNRTLIVLWRKIFPNYSSICSL